MSIFMRSAIPGLKRRHGQRTMSDPHAPIKHRKATMRSKKQI